MNLISRLACTGIITGALSLAMLTGCENKSHDNDSEDSITNNATSTGGSNNNSSDSSDSSSGWGVSSYSATGITPESGAYIFSQRGKFKVETNSTGTASLSFAADSWTYYHMSINNGAFSYRNGCLVESSARSDSGKLYPTDGFAISGHFTTPTTAEGSISYSFSGRVTEGPLSFTASK